MAKIIYKSSFIILLLSVFISCKNNRVKEEKFDSGRIQYEYYFTDNRTDSVYEYFENPHRLKSITRMLSDSMQYLLIFDKEGKKKSEGYTVSKKGKQLKTSWWREENSILTKIEYLPIGDSALTNQYISYDKSGKIDINNSLFYTIDLPDTVDFGRKYFFDVKLNTRIGIGDVFVSKLKLSDQIKGNFSNINETEFTYNLKEIEVNHWRVEHIFKNKKGNDTIKGGIYVKSTWTEDLEHKDSILFVNFEKILYLNKPIFIR